MSHINEFAMGQMAVKFVRERNRNTPTLTIIDHIKNHPDLGPDDTIEYKSGIPRWYEILQNAFVRQMTNHEGIVRTLSGFDVTEEYKIQQRVNDEVVKMQGTFKFPEGHTRQTLFNLALKAGIDHDEINDFITEAFEDSKVVTEADVQALLSQYKDI